MRPLIGITVAFDDRRAGVHMLRQDYVRAVEQGGGLPVLLAPTRAPSEAAALLERLDGLLLSGGEDVDPALYGRERHPRLGTVMRERDEFELALTLEALHRDLPILAICRGHQVLNVATGGTLIQDIPSERAGGVDHDPRRKRWERVHDVQIEPGTCLHAILGKDRAGVNSFHHQAIDTLGEGLVASAVSPDDGIIEGVELPGRRFVIGVQWHPESFWNRPETHQALFAALAEASARS
jgi:putative glutamine amidotransferase